MDGEIGKYTVPSVHTMLSYIVIFLNTYLAQVCVLRVYLSFLICLCPHSFVFPWAVESSPLQFLALA